MSYLLNVWYVAAMSSEVGEGLFQRTLLDRSIVFFRDLDGSPRALDDRCPHRFSPLHMGRKVEGLVECPYHGLRFDGTGACVFNPQGPNGADNVIPRRARVHSYPLVERYGLLWIWPGDVAKANEALIPSFPEWEDPQASPHGGCVRVGANYQLMSDNILDVSHADYIHPGFTDGSMSRGLQEVEDDGEVIVSKFFMPSSRLPPILDPSQDPNGPIMDWWFDATWRAPAILRVDTGRVPAGAPRPESFPLSNIHCFTPETATSTYYFWSVLYDDRAPFTEPLHDYLTRVFEREDTAMLEAQQRAVGGADLLTLDPVVLYHDGAGLLARRRLHVRIADEAQVAVALAPEARHPESVR